MIRLLRTLFLPTASFLLIAGLALTEWSKISDLKKIAGEFHKNSEIFVFNYVGVKEWQDRSIPTYEFVMDGHIIEFPTHSPIDLPPDGRVRLGIRPSQRPPSPFTTPQKIEMAVPINGADSVETVYNVLRGHQIQEDYTKASVVSAAAILAGILGFFLQRIIFRDVRRAYRAR